MPPSSEEDIALAAVAAVVELVVEGDAEETVVAAPVTAMDARDDVWKGIGRRQAETQAPRGRDDMDVRDRP